MRMQRHLLFALAAVAAVAGRLSASPITTISLVTPSSLSFTDNTGTLFSMTTSLPTADFSPFMRLERDCNEQGYNSGGSHATMDDLPGSKLLPMNQVLTSNGQIVLGMNYNEPIGAGHLLTLDELEIVVSTDPNKAGPASSGPWSIQSMPISPGDQVLYQMSSATTGSHQPFDIQLDADHTFPYYVPQDLYVTLDLSHLANLSAIDDSHHYLYVYSRFSDSDCGYEEWFAYKPGSNDCNNGGGGGGVPEPASLSVMALGALGLLSRRRKV